jgi:hypothetical protein
LLKNAASHLFLTADYPCHTGLHIDQAIYSEFRPDSKNNIARSWKQVAIQTEDLPYQPFDPVAPYCITNFSMHTNPQPIEILRVRHKNHGKPIPSAPLAKPINALELSSCPEQVNFRESKTFQQANCLRPFALLLLITAWPARVFIRTRNPWVRERLILLG